MSNNRQLGGYNQPKSMGLSGFGGGLSGFNSSGFSGETFGNN